MEKQSVKIDLRLYRKIKSLANKEGKKIGFVFERALKNYLKLRKAN